MTINIYSTKTSHQAVLCSGNWNLAEQLDALEDWLEQEGKNWPVGGAYICDIGFSPRKGATGGGGVLTCESMKQLVTIGMEVYFSEYCHDEEASSKQGHIKKDRSRKKAQRSTELRKRQEELPDET